jgi:large subunit ribosomal protein L18
MLKKDRVSRKKRIRAKLSGTALRPRLSVFRSNKFVYVQAIDDETGKTMAAARGADAAKVGGELALLLKKHKVDTVVFDRSGYRYHGRVRALADAAREAGLIF